MSLSSAVEALMLELRGAGRALVRARGVIFAAILTLGLGIGASTAIFSVVKGVLLEPLPYREPDRLAIVVAEQDFDGTQQPVRMQWPAATVDAWPQVDSIDRIGFYAEGAAAFAGPQGSELIDVAYVSPLFFVTADGPLVLGRALTQADAVMPSVVISERLWRREFGGEPAALGQTLRLSGQLYTIVGVGAAAFGIPEGRTDVWIPAGFVRTQNPACCNFTAIVRLKPGVAASTATDEIAGVARMLARQMPRALDGVRVRAVPLHEMVVGQARTALAVLTAAVALLLVIACANVMNLLLARQTARRRETAVRRALGASTKRLVLQALAEATLLTTAATSLGIVLAVVSIGALKHWPPSGLPRLDTTGIDGSAVAFACGLAVLVAGVMACLPAFQKSDPAASLHSGQKGTVSARSGRTALRALTVAQLTVSVMLLVGAALLGRSLVALMHTDLGVRPENVVTASLNLAMDRSLTDRQQTELVSRILDRISMLPQVTAAGIGTARPPDASRVRLTLNRTGKTDARAGFLAAGVPATPGYFPALGIRLQHGRLFTGADTADAPPVVVMSADTARLLFGDEDALGRTIQLPIIRDGKTGRQEMTVVGITAPVKYSGIDQAADAVVYRPFAQQPWGSVFLIVRTSGEPERMVGTIRREVAAVDRAITISDVATLEDVLADVTAQPRFRAALLTAFASMAVLIAAIGLYGVIAYSVSQRRSEIGIRMALGADGRRIRAMVLREGLTLAVLGIAMGLVGAYALVHLLSSLLYGIAATDAVSFVTAAALVLGAGVAASYVPAAAAARADPLDALRTE